MTNPVLVEVTRGSIVESRHRGRVIVVDGDGGIVFSQGDTDSAIFPRSANKAMQALPLVEWGAADAYGFSNKELALASSSHSAEAGHLETATRMLDAAGRDVGTLECGAHWGFDQPVIIDQARHLDKPTALHNNCSGKHAGFICAACHAGIDPKGYVTYDHPVQAEIRGIMTALTGGLHGEDNCGTDGCSIPTYAVAMKGLAHGFARMAAGTGLEPVRARAARRIIEACMAEPFHVAGTKRACTRIMQAAPGRIFAKTGAEGVFCAAIPEQGIAMAIKCDDGSSRGAETMVAATLARFFTHEPELHKRLMAIADHDLLNWNKIRVGRVRATEALTA